VPVEEDGSACFYAPVGCEILFQALDARGMAVQSMRSGTYVHAGEHLSCVGCHEDKWRAPGVSPPRRAFRREPSTIEPETSLGPVPASYELLAKPVLEKTCIPCHQSKQTGPQTSDYGQLKPYVFYFDADGGNLGTMPVHGGYRTIPGRFGARESRMGKALLNRMHSGLLAQGKIGADDFRRIVLWLDSNSLRLGSFNNDAAQLRGEIVWPSLEFDPANPLALEGRSGSP
jgi:cytochrome c553